MISSLQSFYAAGMDNISKVALEKLVTLGQSCCLEINFFAQFMQKFSMPGQLIDKWFYRIFNPWRRVERRLGRVGISHKIFPEANILICGRGPQLSLIPLSVYFPILSRHILNSWAAFPYFSDRSPSCQYHGQLTHNSGILFHWVLKRCSSEEKSSVVSSQLKTFSSEQSWSFLAVLQHVFLHLEVNTDC